jgi:hypothetical protein
MPPTLRSNELAVATAGAAAMPGDGILLPLRTYARSPARRAAIGTAEELERLRSELS